MVRLRRPLLYPGALSETSDTTMSDRKVDCPERPLTYKLKDKGHYIQVYKHL